MKMLIKVKVLPKAKNERIVQKARDAFEVEVKEKPQKGLANKRVREILGSRIGISIN